MRVPWRWFRLCQSFGMADSCVHRIGVILVPGNTHSCVHSMDCHTHNIHLSVCVCVYVRVCMSIYTRTICVYTRTCTRVSTMSGG